MIDIAIKIIDDSQAVRKASDAAASKSLARAGFEIRRAAQESIVRSANPSPAGEPPHTRKNLLRRAIRYAADKERQSVVVGPAYSVAGISGAPHEHGGEYKGQRYPERPFMGPALSANREQFPAQWGDNL